MVGVIVVYPFYFCEKLWVLWGVWQISVNAKSGVLVHFFRWDMENDVLSFAYIECHFVALKPFCHLCELSADSCH